MANQKALSSRTAARGYRTSSRGQAGSGYSTSRTVASGSSRKAVSARGQARGYGSRSAASRDKSYGYGAVYNYGAEAQQLDPIWEEEEESRRESRRRASYEQNDKRYEEAGSARSARRAHGLMHHISPAMILGMAALTCVMTMCLMQYITLQSKVTTIAGEVSSLESRLSDLKSDNDERLGEINASINLDDIKFKAISELGMTYAKENQIIGYTNDDNDYVHQVAQITD